MNTTAAPVPIIILGGRGRPSAGLPNEAEGQHLLSGYKAAELKIGGRPLIEELVERLRATGAFDPIYLVGPERVYAPCRLKDVRLVDADLDFGSNIRAATDRVMSDLPQQPVAYATADILPEADDLDRAVDDFRRASPCDFWMLECREPKDLQSLGTSSWKPRYTIRGDEDPAPVPILPGHLVIADPWAVRLSMIYDILELAYRSRNLPISRRRRAITSKIVLVLLRADLGELSRGRLPTVTFDTLWSGTRFVAKLRNGIDHGLMATLLRQIFIKRQHRRRYPRRGGRVAVLDCLSLARDIDTEEEARELLKDSAD